MSIEATLDKPTTGHPTVMIGETRIGVILQNGSRHVFIEEGGFRPVGGSFSSLERTFAWVREIVAEYGVIGLRIAALGHAAQEEASAAESAGDDAHADPSPESLSALASRLSEAVANLREIEREAQALCNELKASK